MFYLRPHNDNSHDHNHEIDETVSKYYNSKLTWEDLIHDCGAYVIIENSAKANEIFNRKYHRQIVEWKGYFLNSFVQVSPFGGNAEHLMNINVRMIPSESLKDPDLFLSMDAKKYNDYRNVIHSLSSGDAIKFRASFESIGNEWRSHHLHLIHIEKTDDFIEEDKKIILFQGVNFNITGHLKAEKELEELKSDNSTINVNNTINSTQNI